MNAVVDGDALVNGQMFKVDADELFEREAHDRNGPPDDLFVLDDQLHMVRSSMPGPQFFRAYAQGPTAAATCESGLLSLMPASVLSRVSEMLRACCCEIA